jgi:hypothetical protein
MNGISQYHSTQSAPECHFECHSAQRHFFSWSLMNDALLITLSVILHKVILLNLYVLSLIKLYWLNSLRGSHTISGLSSCWVKSLFPWVIPTYISNILSHKRPDYCCWFFLTLQSSSNLTCYLIHNHGRRPIYIKLICSWFMIVRNKLGCLSLTSLSSLPQCLRVRPQPTKVKRLSL